VCGSVPYENFEWHNRSTQQPGFLFDWLCGSEGGGLGWNKAWRFWSSMVATLCSSPGFSAISLSGRSCSLRHSSLLRSGVVLRTRFLKTKKFCKVRCIIALLAPFDFAISLLHPQGRDSLKFLKRDELCGFCQLGRSHGSTGLGLQFAYADQTILCLFCAVQGAFFDNQGHCSFKYGLKAATSPGVEICRD